MICIGCSGIVGGIFLINRLRDTPQSLGLPSIEKARNDFPQHNKQNQENELSAKEILFTHVLNKPILWVLGISYFFIYFIRQAISDWMVLYLVEQKGYSQITAGTSLIWFEIGGVLGGLLAGWASDKIFSGNRGPINALFCMMSVLSIYLFTVTPPNVPHAISLLIFTMGFCLFGPVVLIGIAAAELSHKKAAATATGFIGWIAYIGAASAGYPLGQITQSFGWNGFFITLIGSAAITSLLLLPLWKAKTAPSPVRSFVISVRCSRVKSIEKLASTARLCA
jgi:OPA family sugar phosphate sensor protein UhpC-like MFS transporter